MQTTVNPRYKYIQIIAIVSVVMITLLFAVLYRQKNRLGLFSRASATTSTGASIETEDGTANLPAAIITGDATASNNSYIQFNQSAISNFQPSAPYYATFYYPWYRSSALDGSWSYWQDNGHTPPNNWFANYLPDYDTSQFNPSSELYSSNDAAVIYWQLRKLAEAKQEVGISSWWGQGHKTDTAFKNIITNIMKRSDNPYPNFRWTLYYEREGDNGSGLINDPTITEIVNDLNYINANYASQPSFLKINDRPVVFVYADAEDCTSSKPCDGSNTNSMIYRWYQARQQAQGNFYIVLKVFSGHATAPYQPDSWHQYAPAIRSDKQGTFASMVSPGFWKNGDPVRLARDTSAFSTAVQNMVSHDTTWKLVETWNEWGEGTSVEPGDQVIQTVGGTAVLDPNGATFKNIYVDILNQLLPNLEQGTGAN